MINKGHQLVLDHAQEVLIPIVFHQVIITNSHPKDIIIGRQREIILNIIFMIEEILVINPTIQTIMLEMIIVVMAVVIDLVKRSTYILIEN